MQADAPCPLPCYTSSMPTKEQTSRVIRILRRKYTNKPDTDLGNPKDTLLAILLSARTQDAQVLKAYPAFKHAFPTFASLAASTPSKIGRYISTVGLYRSKARAIRELARIMVRDHKGKVPRTFEELIRLPGVGRKSANCVLNFVYGKAAICVDTHVFRVSHRLGWSRAKTPDKTELDLQKIIPKSLWSAVNRVFVQFGRDICRPGRPQCWRCPVSALCAFSPKIGRRDEG
jgi:endonuclease-3